MGTIERKAKRPVILHTRNGVFVSMPGHAIVTVATK